MLGLEELSESDRQTVAIARRLERFLTQPFFTTSRFTGKTGRLVRLNDTLDGCRRILDGEYSAIAEKDLYMIEPLMRSKKDDAGHPDPAG